MIPTVVGDVDSRAVEQLQRCMDASEDCVGGAMNADGHVGYSQPIGGVVAYEEHISPSGVGYDIGCGNKAVKTNLQGDDLRGELAHIMDEIERRISFGMGRKNEEPADHPVLDRIREAEFTPQRALADLAARQLGTVGSGNHYVDLLEDEDGWVWIGVHFGSRGFGHRTATGFLAAAQGLPFDGKPAEGEMDSPPVLFSTRSHTGEDYISAMELAGEYAYAGRDLVCEKVLEILRAEEVDSVHNHHNFAWHEYHHGRWTWVVRKGCTPAFPGQRGFVGATMGEPSVILRGTDPDPDAVSHRLQRDLLFSTVHGAGRVMSRTQAAGKSKYRTRWQCSDRDCTFTLPPGTAPPKHHDTLRKSGEPSCPDHYGQRFRKVRSREQVRPGVVDWDAVRVALRTGGIELRGGGADEAPEAYKRLDEVLAFHAGTIEVEHTLRPLGVAMAGIDTYDPYKD